MQKHVKHIRKRTKINFSLRNLIQIIKSWLEYNAINNKEYALIEEAIRIPICDYLAQIEGELILEKKIEEFENDKKFDLYFKPLNEKKYYFEFKFVQEGYTSSPSEIERFFDDIIRLRTKAKKRNTECYFLAFGIKKDFKDEFSELNKGKKQTKQPQKKVKNKKTFNPLNGRPYTSKGRPRKYGNGNVFEEMFSFKDNDTKTIDFTNKYVKKLKKAFENGYKLTKKVLIKHPDFLKQLYKTKTTCTYLWAEECDFAGLGVWKVDADET